MSDPTSRGDAERPMTQDERDTVKKTGAPATAAAGAVAAGAAALATATVGPIGAGIGMILGALGGAAVGAAGSQSAAEGRYTPDDDEHYRALWEGSPDRPADASWEQARAAYQLGHLAAAHPSYAGRDFDAAEPELHATWDREFGAHYGAWSSSRRYVCDAYGHARSAGFGVRRDASVIGTGGSAVDPVELERARAGLPSRENVAEGTVPVYPADLAATSPSADGAPYGDALGERPEIPANQAHHEDVELR